MAYRVNWLKRLTAFVDFYFIAKPVEWASGSDGLVEHA